MAHISTYKCSRRLYYYYPGFSPGNLVAHSLSKGRNSCRVPIYYVPGSRKTIVDKMPCLRAYASSGLRTHDPLITNREHEPSHDSAPTNIHVVPTCKPCDAHTHTQIVHACVHLCTYLAA